MQLMGGRLEAGASAGSMQSRRRSLSASAPPLAALGALELLQRCGAVHGPVYGLDGWTWAQFKAC